jgi:hypothetical protein
LTAKEVSLSVAKMKRCIAAMLCLLYLTVSTVLAVPHVHADDEDSSSQCRQCHWKQNSIADEPTPSFGLVRVEFKAGQPIFLECPQLGVPSSTRTPRGPPLRA